MPLAPTANLTDRTGNKEHEVQAGGPSLPCYQIWTLDDLKMCNQKFDKMKSTYFI